MAIIKKVQKQALVYWAPANPNKAGKRTYGPPQAMLCRWEQKQDEVTNAVGTIQVTQNYLITQYMLEPEGMVLLGEIQRLPKPTDPQLCGAVRVVATAHTPNIKQTQHLYEAWA